MKLTHAIPRRSFLRSLPALLMAPRIGQSGEAPIQIGALNHVTLTVSDPQRSLEFYQGLFGMPVQARQAATTLLRIGGGPQFLALSRAGANATPRISHFCMTVQNFNVDRIVKALANRGIAKSDAGGPMKVRVRMRGPEAGGARDGTPELYLGDPDGIVVQLQDATYCGGAGALGNICSAVESPLRKGRVALRDLSHVTVFVSDAQRSNTFYQELFGLSVQAYQGPSAPLLAVGPGVQFVMLAGGGAARGGANATPRAASINHFCMNMEGFKPDEVLDTLEAYGIKRRGSAQGPVGPMTSYVTLRMENRGGAPGGTPELYFTDPDGILVQLQDVSYCGGAGYLGNDCP